MIVSILDVLHHNYVVTLYQSVQHNGSWHLHLFLVKYGYPLDPEEEEYSSQAVVYNSVGELQA